MRVLIVGCGYIGLPLGALLASRGHEVYGLRRTRPAQAELTAAGLVPITADITQPETLPQLRARFDWAVFCVASAGGTADHYRRLYLEGARNVVQWLTSLPPQKFVYTSSTSVYAQTDGALVDETARTEPLVETSRVLLETENSLREPGRTGSPPAIILRLAGIYGPGRGYWLRQLLKGEARLEGQGQRILNMIHRDDVVGAATKVLECAHAGEIFNLVDDEPVTQRTLLEWLSKRLGGEFPPGIPDTAAAAGKRGLTSKRVSNRKLKEQLGYRFKYPTFREGYEAEIRSLEQNGRLALPSAYSKRNL